MVLRLRITVFLRCIEINHQLHSSAFFPLFFLEWSLIVDIWIPDLAEAMKPGIVRHISTEEPHDGGIKGCQNPIEMRLVVDDVDLGMEARQPNSNKILISAKPLQVKGAYSNPLGFLLRNGARAKCKAPLVHPPWRIATRRRRCTRCCVSWQSTSPPVHQVPQKQPQIWATIGQLTCNDPKVPTSCGKGRSLKQFDSRHKRDVHESWHKKTIDWATSISKTKCGIFQEAKIRNRAAELRWSCVRLDFAAFANSPSFSWHLSHHG